MPVILCVRDADPVPPFRSLYGQRNGTLVFPLDLAFTNYDAPGSMSPPAAPILGANILGQGGNVLATNLQYDWPMAGAVSPIVTATPTGNIDLGQVLALPAGQPQPFPTLTQIQVVDSNGNVIRGTLGSFTTVPYLDFSHTIDAYESHFTTPLFAESHGQAAFLAGDPNVLVGMVIVGKQNDSGVNTYIARI